jgi:hypothetical protein
MTTGDVTRNNVPWFSAVSAIDVAVTGTDWVDVITIAGGSPGGMELTVVTKNTGAAQAFSDYQILRMVHSSEPTWKVLLTGANFATASNLLKSFSTTVPNSLAAAAESWQRYDIGPCYAVKIQVKIAATTTTASVYAAVCNK